MEHCAPTNHPGDIYLTLSSTDSPSTASEIAVMALVPYREIMGMLNHLVVHTLPEMAYHLSSLARFVTAPGPPIGLQPNTSCATLKVLHRWGFSISQDLRGT